VREATKGHMSNAQSHQVLTEHESKKILEENGFRVTKMTVAKTREEAVQAAKSIGFPVALKIVSPDIIHKTDANGVRLELSSVVDVERAFDEIVGAARSYNPDARIEGVGVQEFVSDGIEVIVGSKRDETFGPVVIFGLGGIFVDLFEDVSMRIVPFTELDIREMIREIKGYKILQGHRYAKKADIPALIELISKTESLVDRDRRIVEMDLNPVKLLEEGKGAIVVDARIMRER